MHCGAKEKVSHDLGFPSPRYNAWRVFIRNLSRLGLSTNSVHSHSLKVEAPELGFLDDVEKKNFSLCIPSN